MKKVTIKNYTKHSREVTPGDAPNVHEFEGEALEVSDGYHTIEELYDHRITLFIALCKVIWRRYSDMDMTTNGKEVWRSKLHHDGTGYDGWFMLAIGEDPGKQITYHIPMSRWKETDFANTFDKAPVPFDGHSSADVLERLKAL